MRYRLLDPLPEIDGSVLLHGAGPDRDVQAETWAGS